MNDTFNIVSGNRSSLQKKKKNSVMASRWRVTKNNMTNSFITNESWPRPIRFIHRIAPIFGSFLQFTGIVRLDINTFKPKNSKKRPKNSGYTPNNMETNQNVMGTNQKKRGKPCNVSYYSLLRQDSIVRRRSGTNRTRQTNTTLFDRCSVSCSMSYRLYNWLYKSGIQF